MGSLQPPSNFYQWLFLDLNSYFASVEQQDHPALRGKPIIVTPSPSEYTCAIAASYEAKKFGIKTGTKIMDAKRLCPQLICVPARHDVYVRYHHRIIEEAAKHVPIFKICSIDEFSSKLPARFHSREKIIQLAAQLKSALHHAIGPAIHCSIGVSSNSFLAKIASDMQKPNGLVMLDHSNVPARLFDLRLTDLPGINVRMEYRLARGNIWSVEDFWNSSPKQMRAIWGSVTGERFWYHLHGYELPEIETKSSMIGHSRILDPEHRSPEVALLVARRLILKAASRLRRAGFYAGKLALSVRETSLTSSVRMGKEESHPPPTAGRSYDCVHRFITPISDNQEFLKTIDLMWAKMIRDLRPHRLKKISVAMFDLYQAQERMRDLFEDMPIIGDQSDQSGGQHTASLLRGPQAEEKSLALSEVMDQINAKYGAETLQIGISPKTQAGYVGTKIAFHRIPQMEEFYE